MGGVVHILKHWPCGGGMEAIARLHRARGESLYAFAAANTLPKDDKNGEARLSGATRLGNALPNRGVATVAREARTAWAEERWTTGIFYNGYGLGWGAEPGPEARRVLYLHSDYPGFNRWIRRLAPHADGVLCCNAALREKTLHAAPGLPRERLFTLPLAVDVPEAFSAVPPSFGGAAVIGYSGRVQVAQKRLDRLGDFFAALESAKVDFRFEILGEGEALPELRRRFAGNPRVVFHGRRSGAEYWNILRGWKYLFFCSDYEGLPVALLEGVAAGAVPVYPDFHGGTDWPAQLDPGLLYPIGDMRSAADVVRRVETGWGPAPWALFRKRAAVLLAAHTRENYFAVWDEALAALAALPPRHRVRPAPWLRLFPLWLTHRLETRLRGTDEPLQTKRWARIATIQLP